MTAARMISNPARFRADAKVWIAQEPGLEGTVRTYRLQGERYVYNVALPDKRVLRDVEETNLLPVLGSDSPHAAAPIAYRRLAAAHA